MVIPEARDIYRLRELASHAGLQETTRKHNCLAGNGWEWGNGGMG